ncbi:hypothetical protein ISCGN_006410, partial [Ixodes scapularis]
RFAKTRMVTLHRARKRPPRTSSTFLVSVRTPSRRSPAVTVVVDATSLLYRRFCFPSPTGPSEEPAKKT